jgi:hypothetical protein
MEMDERRLRSKPSRPISASGLLSLRERIARFMDFPHTIKKRDSLSTLHVAMQLKKELKPFKINRFHFHI